MKKRYLLSILIIIIFLLFIFLFVYNPKLLGYITFGDPYFNNCLTNLVDNFSPLNSKAIVYLKFNNLSSYGEYDLIACDFSGHNNTALLSNPFWNSSGGPFMDGAFEFKGNNDISILDKDELSPSTTQAFSVSFWIKPSTFNFAGTAFDHDCECAVHPVSKYSSFLGNNREWYFRLYNATAVDGSSNRPKRISFYVFNLSGSIGAGSYFQDNLNENEWIHVIGIMNGTHTFIYKNGVLRDSDAISNYGITMGNGAAPVVLGAISHGGYFQGSIDELRIFNRSLNATEISDLYNMNLSSIKNGLNVNIISPTNTTYALSNYSIDINLNKAGYCEYSLDGGNNNNTLLSNASNTGFALLKTDVDNGSYILNSYCNSSLGVKNYTERVFFSINSMQENNSEEVQNSATSGSSASSGSSGGSDGSGGSGSATSNTEIIIPTDTEVEKSPPESEEPSNFQDNKENTNSQKDKNNLIGLAVSENLEKSNKNKFLIQIALIFIAVCLIVAHRKLNAG